MLGYQFRTVAFGVAAGAAVLAEPTFKGLRTKSDQTSALAPPALPLFHPTGGGSRMATNSIAPFAFDPLQISVQQAERIVELLGIKL